MSDALRLSGTSVECNQLEQLSEKRSSNSSSISSNHTVCTDIAGGNTHHPQFENNTNLCDGSQQLNIDSTDSEDKNSRNNFEPLFSIGTGFDEEPVTTCFENNLITYFFVKTKTPQNCTFFLLFLTPDMPVYGTGFIERNA